MTFELLSEALDHVRSEIKADEIELSNDAQDSIDRKYCFGGVQYGDIVKCDVPIERLNGKFTRKWFHIVIERFSHNGRYEVVTYAL